MNSNKVKADLLGMPFGTANARLKKSLLFYLSQQLKQDICYRCKVQITDLNDFSIEHTQSWQYAEDPIEVFFDVKRIAFSHISCNISASFKPTKVYESEKERQTANWKRRYADPIRYEEHLDRKRKSLRV